jgi:hypothetical protein
VIQTGAQIKDWYRAQVPAPTSVPGQMSVREWPHAGAGA